MNYDKDKMREFLFNSPYYKHINVFLPVISYGLDIEEHLMKWIGNEENLKFLRCMELLQATNNFDEDGYGLLLEKVRNHKSIKVEDWYALTKGVSFIAAGGQFFAVEYVALKIALDFGGDEMKQVLHDSFESRYLNDKKYEVYFEHIFGFTHLSEEYQHLAIHIIAEEDRCWYSYFYTREQQSAIMIKRAGVIVQALSELM